MKKSLLALAALFFAQMGQLAQAALPVQHWQGKGGAAVYWIENHSLPMLDVRIEWDAGTRRNPPSKAGVASALAIMLGKGVAAQGGDKALDENALADAWADLAAQPSFAADQDRMSVSLRVLTRPDVLPKAIDLLSRQLAQPSLNAAVWQRERAMLIAALQEANTRPGVVAQNTFVQTVYGRHPYGAIPSAGSVQGIEVADLRQFHDRYLRPCSARISMVGDLTRAQAQQIADGLMAGLSKTCPALPALAPVPDWAQAKTIKMERAGAQTQVLLGQIGIARNDPDFFAFLVGNQILGGGGFSSLLMQKVREDNGLVYGINSDFLPLRDRGAFLIGFQTRPEQAQRAIALTRQVLSDFVQHGPTAAQLQAAKDHLMGGFPSRMDSNAKLLDMLANIAWNDLPLDYLDHWTARVGAISATDIQRIFARVVHPNALLLVEVGPHRAAPAASSAASAANLGGKLAPQPAMPRK